ncbi:MAG: GtrA family protein [Terriglobales bacterium]
MNASTPQHVRWLKFSFVGAIGIGVQLGALFLFIRLRLPYLLATALAVACAVLHNFIWHERFTWADRAHGTRPAGILVRLLRFCLANAAISIVGNLLLMWLLVGQAGLPVLPANLISISACYMANFLVSDRWVFLAPKAQFPDVDARSPISNKVRWEKGT